MWYLTCNQFFVNHCACPDTLICWQTIHELGFCLDDPKRLVRQEAVSTRSCWFLIGAPGESTQTWCRRFFVILHRDRKQLNVFERKVYRRILGPVYENEKENWRILTNKEIYAIVKKTHYNRDNKVKKLHWFGHVQRMEDNRIWKQQDWKVDQETDGKMKWWRMEE